MVQRMADSDRIKRQLKEDRIPEAFWPDEWGEKKKRPREIAVIFCAATRGRLHARLGGLAAKDVQGKDGLR